MHLRNALAFIVSVTLGGLVWFFASKPIQISREWQLAAGKKSWPALAPETMADAFVAGMFRRLDDVSLWNTITAALAALLMIRALSRAELTTAAAAVPFKRVRALALGLGVGAILTALYLWAVYTNQGTIFHGRRNPDAADATIKTLQFVEGLVNIAVIFAASFLLPIGLHLVAVIEVGVGAATKADPPSHCEDLRRAAAALAGAILAPLASTLLAFAGWKVIRAFAPINPAVLGNGSKWWVVVLFCSVLCLQFVILGTVAWKALRTHFQLKVDVLKMTAIAIFGAITSVGSLVLYLVVDTAWRGPVPCGAGTTPGPGSNAVVPGPNPPPTGAGSSSAPAPGA